MTPPRPVFHTIARCPGSHRRGEANPPDHLSPLAVKIYRATRADSLVDTLGNLLRTPAGGPFEPEVVVVSGRTAERWIATRLAQRLGVVANIHFISPSRLVEDMTARVVGSRAGNLDAWRQDNLRWTILALLPSLLTEASFAPVRHFLGDQSDDSGAATARMVNLAGTIAASFSSYMMFRPQQVCEWSAGGGGETGWQPALWSAVHSRIGHSHLAELALTAIEQLQSGTAPVRPLPRRISWLTNAGAPPLALGLFGALARGGVDTHLLVLSAMPASATHPLAASMGRAGREFESLLANTIPAPDELPISSDVSVDGDSMLHRLQTAIRTGRRQRGPGEPATPILPGDRSIRVHSCHGRLRQVEVLRDELLRLFDSDPGLEPRDVLVLCPTLPEYAPLIDAVFQARTLRAGDGEPPSIPVRIADMPLRNTNPVAGALLRALAIAGSSMDTGSVLELLSMDPVAARYGFDGPAQERIATWVQEVAIRRSFDGTHRGELGLPAVNLNSWRFGLDRLLLGTAMPGDGRAMFAGLPPYDEIEGQNAELLGRLVDACERILGRLRSFDSPRTVAEWGVELSALLGELVPEDEPQLASGVGAVRAVIGKMVDGATSADFQGRLDIGSVRVLLEESMEETAGMRGGAGAVTFAALRPGRVVPARVIAMLGMDEDSFPRRPSAPGFDIIARTPMVGDSDPASDDRQRFLEAMMAAGDHLVITYGGRALDTNDRIAPSVVVDELLNELCTSFSAGGDAHPGRVRDERVRAAVCREHALQPFNPSRFASDAGGERGWDDADLAAARALCGVPRSAPPFLTRPLDVEAEDSRRRVIQVEELAMFFENPARALVRRSIGLSLSEESRPIPPREPLELDALEKYSARSRLLTLTGIDSLRVTGPRDVSMHGAEVLLTAEGGLPHGSPGTLAFRRAAREANSIASAVASERGDAEGCMVAIELELGSALLRGTIGPVYANRLVLHRAGRLRNRDHLRLWVLHLALQAVYGEQLPLTSIMVAVAEGTPQIVELGPVKDPVPLLDSLVLAYLRGLRAPLPLFEEESYLYANRMIESRKRAEHSTSDGTRDATAAVLELWGGRHEDAMRGRDGGDPYATLVSGDWEPGDRTTLEPDPDFAKLAMEIWEPLLDHTIRG